MALQAPKAPQEIKENRENLEKKDQKDHLDSRYGDLAAVRQTGPFHHIGIFLSAEGTSWSSRTKGAQRRESELEMS